MLAFGFKVAWFALSLSGVLSSIVALPAFIEALDGYVVPGLYTLANFALQGIFCLGMIWKMDPLAMPKAFCTVQPAIITISWLFITFLTSGLAFSSTWTILRTRGGVIATPCVIRSSTHWQLRNTCLFLVLAPMATFVIYLVLALKFDAVQPADGMHCDVTRPVWVRLLSYAGVPLLLAVPSFVLTCAAAYQFYTHCPRHYTRSFEGTDHFTPVPLRRQSRLGSNHVYHEAKNFDPTPGPEPSAIPDFCLTATGPSVDERSLTPSGTILVAEAIPSPPDSLSSGHHRVVAGRAPTVTHTERPLRYHLPFQWRFNQIRSSPDPLRSSPDASLSLYSRHTPSPLVFANPVEQGNPPGITTVSVTPDPSERMYDAAPWLKDEKLYLGQTEKANRSNRHLHAHHHNRHHNTSKHEIHDGNDDDDDDAASGSLRWIRSSEETVSTAKSEIEFARTPPREDFDQAAPRRPSPVELSTYDAGLTETPIPNFTGVVWRILFFQLLSSTTQILATISSLVDMLSGRDAAPLPFGTQQVALLLVAWAPLLSFGARWPFWRWKLEPRG